MNRWQYLVRGLRHYWRSHLAVLLAVAVATGVLTGALIVGDSVRGSLRELALERLGRISHVMVANRFLSKATVSELMADPQLANATIVPACLLPSVTVERTERGLATDRSRGVFLLACGPEFWSLDDRSHGDHSTAFENSDLRTHGLTGNSVAVNQALADDLRLSIGDEVTIRLPSANQVPADSALGRKEGRTVGLTSLVVRTIVPNKGLAKFALHPSQAQARNVFVALEQLQSALDVGDAVNAICVAPAKGQPEAALDRPLAAAFRPDLEDCGLSISRPTMVYTDSESGQETTVWEYYLLTNDRLLWDEPTRLAAVHALEGIDFQEMLTYMANAIELVRTSEEHAASVPLPYSTITAADNHPRLGPLTTNDGSIAAALAPGEIALNRWAANQLSAQVGDTIRITYFLPETTHGTAIEGAESFRLAMITPLTAPVQPFRRRRPAVFDQRPTLANDTHLTPTVEGITDQDSIDDWNPPFPFDQSRIRPRDDAYWDDYRTTPKAFLSLSDGKRLWGSRFGDATGFRIPLQEGVDENHLRARLRQALAAESAQLGFSFQPIRRDSLRAAAGTTPFAALFLGFSMFLIAAALMLIGVLFRLGVDLRAQELGTLRATGWRLEQVSRLVLAEAAIVATAGVITGIALAVGYAKLMIAGLRSWWLAAIVSPFLTLHVQPTSLIIGGGLSLLMALAVVALSLRRLKNFTVVQLIRGQADVDAVTTQPQVAPPAGGAIDEARAWPVRWRSLWSSPWACIGFALTVVLLFAWGTQMQGEAQAGLFFGTGALSLAGLLAWLSGRLRAAALMNASSTRFGPLELAWRTASRHSRRSVLTIGLMASATFLIASIAAFRLAPAVAGTGGFTLLAESDQPIHRDLSDREVQRELFGRQSEQLNDVTIRALRVRAGDDASCRNLYQARQPRLLGVSRQMIDYFDRQPNRFALSTEQPATVGDQIMANPWRCLQDEGTREVIPVILDKNTALYSLHLPAKVGHEFELDFDRPLRFRIVGLLANSIFQGSLLVNEEDLVRIFPETSGYQMFLIGATDSARALAAGELLETRFRDEGLDAQSCADLLTDLLAVQNTYLSTFQMLGSLGLLLGTFGLAAVQCRSVLTRAGELALLSAIGFSERRIQWQLIWENSSLLLAGLGIGLAAAALAVVPHVVYGEASFPLATVAGLLAIVLIVGLLAGCLAAALARRVDTISALRAQ